MKETSYNKKGIPSYVELGTIPKIGYGTDLYSWYYFY